MTTPSANSNIGIHNTDRWYFTKEQIINSPSYKTGQISTAKETSYRQHAALFIQEMGQKLNVWVPFTSENLREEQSLIFIIHTSIPTSSRDRLLNNDQDYLPQASTAYILYNEILIIVKYESILKFTLFLDGSSACVMLFL